jgi:hypothetical protein
MRIGTDILGTIAGFERLVNTGSVNNSETLFGWAVCMTHARIGSMTRRSFGLALGLTGAGFAAGRGFAAPAPLFPLRIAIARMGEGGLMRVPTEHQQIWAAFSTRLGGLVEDIVPVQPTSLIDLSAPADDGGAACASQARGFADRLGCSQVILYATADGIKRGPYPDLWIKRAFQHIREAVQINDRALGEAYLLDAAGGAPLVAASADADRATPVDTLTGRHNEIDTLKLLTSDLERRVQNLARPLLAAQASRGD